MLSWFLLFMSVESIVVSVVSVVSVVTVHVTIMIVDVCHVEGIPEEM